MNISKNEKTFQPILKLKTTSLYLPRSLAVLKSVFDGYSDEILEQAVKKAKTEIDSGKFKYEESYKKKLKIVKKAPVEDQSVETMESSSKKIKLKVVEKASVEDMSVKTKKSSVAESESGVKINVPKKKTIKIPKKETKSSITLQGAYKTWKNAIDQETLLPAKKIELSEKILAKFDNDENRADAKKKLMLTEIRLYLDQNKK